MPQLETNKKYRELPKRFGLCPLCSRKPKAGMVQCGECLRRKRERWRLQTPFIVPNVANHLNQVSALVEDFISCALGREGLQRILNSTGWHLSPIKEDTENWACASNVREKCLRVSCAESTTGWHRNGIMKELPVEFSRYEREAREQGRGLWGKSRERYSRALNRYLQPSLGPVISPVILW